LTGKNIIFSHILNNELFQLRGKKEHGMDIQKIRQKPQVALLPQCTKVALLVNQLTDLSVQNFPIDAVIASLHAINLTAADVEPYTFFSDARYTRNCVYKASAFELILMCWRPGQASAVHGHEGQKCWMRVLGGSLEFTEYQDQQVGDALILNKISTKIGEQGFVDGPAYIHGVRNNSEGEAMSLHLYAHPFNQCDAYDAQTGDIKKIQLGYYSIGGKRC
jgi:cysteine dioxygenase